MRVYIIYIELIDKWHVLVHLSKIKNKSFFSLHIPTKAKRRAFGTTRESATFELQEMALHFQLEPEKNIIKYMYKNWTCSKT